MRAVAVLTSCLGAMLFALLALPAHARHGPGAMIEIAQGEPIVLHPEMAYFVLRTYRPKGVPNIEPVFLRVPDENELQAYYREREMAFEMAEPGLVAERKAVLAKQAAAEAAGKPFKKPIPPVPSLATFNFVWPAHENVENLDAKRFIDDADPVRTYLVELPPGEYVLYGATFGGIAQPALHVCFCLGTVGFEAKAGKILDLGTFLADQAKERSTIAELAAETGFGPSSDSPIWLIAGTVRPATAADRLPEAMAGRSVEPAEYHAVGKFFNPGATAINRLVPVPGVLSYDRGKVIDVKTGKTAIDRP